MTRYYRSRDGRVWLDSDNTRPPGRLMDEAEGRRLYEAQRREPEEKQVEAEEVEDKQVSEDEVEDKAPNGPRRRGRPRGS